MKGRIIFIIRLILIFSIIIFTTSKKNYAQSIVKSGNVFQMDFTEGFNNVRIQLMDSGCKKVAVEEILNTDKVLGFARSVTMIKGKKCCVKVNNKTYLINTSKTKYAYINFVNGFLSIEYTDKKRLYE